MRERTFPVRPIAHDSSCDGNALPVAALTELLRLLGLIEERHGFGREMGPVIGIRVRLEAPFADGRQLVQAVLPHLAELVRRRCLRLISPRGFSQFPAPCPADCFRKASMNGSRSPSITLLTSATFNSVR